MCVFFFTIRVFVSVFILAKSPNLGVNTRIVLILRRDRNLVNLKNRMSRKDWLGLRSSVSLGIVIISRK